MKDKIEVTTYSNLIIPKCSYRRKSLKHPNIYYEFKIQYCFINSEKEYKEFEKICDEYLLELDGKLE